MKIGIDGRLWNETGVGRYIRALVFELGTVDTHNNYTLFLRKPQFEALVLPNARWKKILADVSWHTLAEQFLMPGIYKSAGVDLLHIPYFSVPIMTPVPFVVTVHDLTVSHFATGKATTKPLPIYWLKKLAYQFVITSAIRRARRIIAVSQFVKKQLIDSYHLPDGRVSVTYEAGSLELGKTKTVNLPLNYILYVGNAHPHKNIESLIKAFELVRHDFPALELVLVGKSDYFYIRLKAAVDRKQIPGIKFVGELDNGELFNYYKNARTFIFPSFSEGFGIPGLEAMNLDCPVVASDIPVFREIYQDGAVYFDPKSFRDIAQKIKSVISDSKLRDQLIKLGRDRVKYFSWRKMAEKTLEIYENCASLRPGQ